MRYSIVLAMFWGLVGAQRGPELTNRYVTVLADPSSSSLESLASAAASAALPLGIVVVKDEVSTGCVGPSKIPAGRYTVSELAEVLNKVLPDYVATEQSGVLRVEPRVPSSALYDLLHMSFRGFQPPAGTATSLASSLWFHVRAQIAPSRGTAITGFVPSNESMISGLDLHNVTFGSVLDSIVRSDAKGGFWLVQGDRIKVLDVSTPKAFTAFSYQAQESLPSAFKSICSRE